MESGHVKSFVLKLDHQADSLSRGTRLKEKHLNFLSKFIRSRFIVLLLGPCFGLFLYYYITYLVLDGDVEDTTNISAERYEPPIEKPTVQIPWGGDRFQRTTRHIIGGSIGGGVGIGIMVGGMVSRRWRCATLLMIPSLLSGRGRAFMLTTATAFLLSGPVATIDHNIQEVVRGLTCMYETVKTIAEDYVEQLQSLFDSMGGLLAEMNERVKETMQLLKDQVENATADTRRVLENSRKEVENQVDKFKEKLDDLQKVLNAPGKVAGKICDAGKSAISFVKKSFKNLKAIFGRRKKRDTCGLPAVVPELDVNIPDVNLDALKNFIASLNPDINLVDFDWEDVFPALKHSSIADIREKLKGILQGFFDLIKEYSGIAKKIFYLCIVMIIWDAAVYMRKYYSDLSYDNMFVDDNLRELWRSGQKEKLTPLRQWELNMKFQYSAAVKLSKQEIKRIALKAIPTLLFTIVATSIILADVALSSVLQIFEDEAKFGISFDGMEKGIKFESLIPELKTGDVNLASLRVQGFNLTTDPCLPRPKNTDYGQLAIVATICAVSGLSCLFDAYASRLRAKICNMCFPDRAEERAGYLYKRIQTGRKTRRIQLSMVVSRELDIRDRQAYFFSSWIWLKKTLLKREVNDSICPGCNSNFKQGEGKEFGLIRNNRKIKTYICKSCHSDVA